VDIPQPSSDRTLVRQLIATLLHRSGAFSRKLLLLKQKHNDNTSKWVSTPLLEKNCPRLSPWYLPEKSCRGSPGAVCKIIKNRGGGEGYVGGGSGLVFFFGILSMAAEIPV